MNPKSSKKFKQLFLAIDNLNKSTKTILKVGVWISIFLLLTSAAISLFNIISINYSSQLNLISNSLIKTSFTILAESVIGCLLVDHFFKVYSSDDKDED